MILETFSSTISLGSILILLSIVVAVQTIRSNIFRSLRDDKNIALDRARQAEKENVVLRSKTDLTVFLAEQEKSRIAHTTELTESIHKSEERIQDSLSKQA